MSPTPESTVSQTAGEIPLGVEYGETALRQAHAAITRSGKDVEVETAVVGGDPAQILLAESRTAELVCVGSSGIGAIAKTLLGSVAATLTENASCPVAVIRSRDDGRRSPPAPRSPWPSGNLPRMRTLWWPRCRRPACAGVRCWR